MSSAHEKILVVDDEPDLLELVSYNLRKEGFEVIQAADGMQGLRLAREGGIDLVVLDLMLPGIPGLELCRMLRADPKTSGLPVIMLTAKGEEIDRVLGLEMGADDYIPKPFSPRELIARVRAVLRRSARVSAGPAEAGTAGTVTLGELVIDPERYIVTRRGEPITLSATEFRLLLVLAKKPGRIFSREQLLDAAWADEGEVEPRTVDVHIRRLRSRVEEDPARPIHIKTRRGVGYYADDGCEGS